jgi:ABC-type sugar transport system ATPase subunit
MPESVSIKDIHKSFAAKVLDGVSFDVERGSIHGLVGENGAGKTTLIRILSGLLKADTGTIKLSGTKFSPRSRREAIEGGIALVSQELSLIETLSIAENILISSLPSKFFRLNQGQMLKQARFFLEEVGLEHLNHSEKLSSLTLPDKQMIEFAKALATEPKNQRLLILDEPTSALSPTKIDHMHEILKEKSQKGLSVLYVSHDLEDVIKICDQITVLRDGKVALSHKNGSLTEEQLVLAMSGSDSRVRANRTPRQIGAPALKIKALSSNVFPNPISLEVKRGEILGIAGLGGSGRSELLHTIFGLENKLSGQAILSKKGKDISIESAKDAVSAGLALIPEDRKYQGIFAGRPLTINTLISGLARSESLLSRLLPSEERKKTGDLLERLHAKYQGTFQKIDELSGGNQQKVLVARWLNAKASVWLLDEPTRGVDVGSKSAIHKKLKELADDGAAMIVVSSDLDELMKISDRILVLSKKRFVSMFSPDEWSKHKILEAAFNLKDTKEESPTNTTTGDKKNG